MTEPVDNPGVAGLALSAWWISWYAASMAFELHSPWWITGYGADDSPTIVAAVLAEDADAARAVIVAAYDEPPSEVRWRFCDPLPPDRPLFSDRFPQADWHAWDPLNGVTCACPDHERVATS